MCAVSELARISVRHIYADKSYALMAMLAAIAFIDPKPTALAEGRWHLRPADARNT